MAHLRVVVGSVELSKHDPAEGRQRSSTLLVGQQAPELIERQRPNDSRARGGAMSAASGDMVHLLRRWNGGIQSIPPTAAGLPRRFWASPPISVKTKEWGQSGTCFLPVAW